MPLGENMLSGNVAASPRSFPGAKARSWAGRGEARPGQSSLSAGALCYRAWAQSWSSAGVEAHSALPSTGLQAPAGSQPLLSGVPGIGLQTWDQSTAQSSLILGWFPCAAAVLGSPNAEGKPAQYIHLPLGGRTAPGKARAGRRFLGTNGATLWLWSCLPKPGAPGP